MSPGFRVYATMDQRMRLSEVAAHARRAEALGYSGLCVPESVHDGLAAATVALQATENLHVATSVLVVFPRSPMIVANAAWDLQEMSGGRFGLGIGSQVRGNIVGRYGTSWTPPVPRMREYVHALRAIFDCWQNGTKLEVEGEHYNLNRMQPFFRPDPLDCDPIPIYLGGVGPGMTALAGEVSEGLMTHPTNTTPRYLREVIHPRLDKGAARVDRSGPRADLMVGPLMSTGPTQKEVDAGRANTRQLLTFLYSTPSYWPSLELFGWEERGKQLHQLTREGKWQEMEGIVDEEMLDTFSPTGTYDAIADVLKEWYADLTDWITFPMPEDPANDDEAAKVLAKLREA